VDRPRYKTWVRTRPLVAFAVLTVVSVALAGLAVWHLVFLAFLVPAGIFGYIVLIVGLSRWRSSPSGGDWQNRVHQLLVQRVTGNSVLDIGCGSGHLLAEIARARPAARLTGLDFWGPNWHYSRQLCLDNFKAEGMDGRADFIHGSASRLPSDLGLFECVVSCMTFHEVRDVVDKTVSLREAVSHLAPGGKFVFVDLFGDRGFYPDDAAIERAITESGGHIEERQPLDALLPLPFPLRHKRVLGCAQLISGARKD
jgi:SAM-dependent methyltransferase